MFVKWRGIISSIKDLPAGGPQRTSLGLWSFLSQTNDNPEKTEKENILNLWMIRQFLGVVNLLSIGIASHNYRASVPSNVRMSGLVISNANLKEQGQLRYVILL